MRSWAVLNSLTILLSCAAEEARAQESSSLPERPHTAVPTGADPVYPADFYTPFQPQTALDMLMQTPGFQISGGGSVRGFGGAAGNVLIDGQRPTVKAGGVSEVLRRIPASRVERIRLIRGTEAAEAQGQTLIADVILKADATGSGNASLTAARTNDGHVSPAGRISYARRMGDWQTSVELSAETARYPSDATYLVRDAAGILMETRVERQSGKAPEYGLAASASRPWAGGTLTLNGRLNHDLYKGSSLIDIHSGAWTDPVSTTRRIAYDEESTSGELGVDWTRGIGRDWTAKLVGLSRMEWSRSDEDYAQPGYRGLSSLHQKPLEMVARATVGRGGNHAMRPEFGVELAYNRLASALDYAEDMGSGLVPVALSGSDVRVSELRGEAFANATLRITPKLSAETGVAVELSRISVAGDLSSSQSLSYVKPSAALVWSLSGKTQLRLGIRRTVDQLSFGDFAASVDQANRRPLGGNAALRPARLTRALLRLDHRWKDGGALSVEAFHQWHDGMLGYLLLPTGEEALGTIGDARQWGISAEATVPLGFVLPGARLTLNGKLHASRFRDPITGEKRDMDSLVKRSLSAEFRHDVAALRSSWGVSYSAPTSYDIFYNREQFSGRTAPVWTAFVETTAICGIKATLTASGFTGQDSGWLRRFYAGSRAGAYSGSERQDQRQGAVISLTLAKAI